MDKSLQNQLKKKAALSALEYIEKKYLKSKEDILVGVGTGSTVSFAFPGLSGRKEVTAIPTSHRTEDRIRKLGMRVRYLKDIGDRKIAVDIDGADEVDPKFNLIKGGGGCHTMEKEVAKRSKELVIVVDETKMVDYLGQTHAVPVEVERGKIEEIIQELKERNIGYGRVRMKSGRYYITDRKNIMIDVRLRLRRVGEQLVELEEDINSINGVVDNGIFAKRKADKVFVGKKDGVEVLER